MIEYAVIRLFSMFLLSLSVYFAFIFYLLYKLEKKRQKDMEDKLTFFLMQHEERLEVILNGGKLDGK